MKFLFILILVCIIYPQKSFCGDKKYYEQFISDLISESNDIEKYFSPGEAKMSGRLGISYSDTFHKLLISYDIDKEIKEKIIANKLSYDVQEIKIDDNFTEVEFSINSNNYKKSFYFKNKKLISRLTYFTKDWATEKSKYFKFLISTPSLFNEYCKDELDKFTYNILELLNTGSIEKKLLEEEKILYILCKDEEEIKKVTGFNTRGMFVLSDDAVVTTYNFHIHEVSHLLINFKLRSLPLYTLPFIQEGFAVALGGRGGFDPGVLMDIGYFTLKSNFISINSILTKNDFQSEDPSITYPASGLYVNFLLKERNMPDFLSIYRKLSGSSEFVSSLDSQAIGKLILLSNDQMNQYESQGGVYLNTTDETGSEIYKGSLGVIRENVDNYFFKLNSPVLITTKRPVHNYESKKFAELFPNRIYKGEKYFLNINPGEIKLYNLYTNQLVASYDKGFSNHDSLNGQDSVYVFRIPKDLFDDRFSDLSFQNGAGY